MAPPTQQEGNRQEGNRQEGNRQEGNRNHPPPIRTHFHNMFLFPQHGNDVRRHDDKYARRFDDEDVDNDADNDACAYDSAYTQYYNDRN